MEKYSKQSFPALGDQISLWRRFAALTQSELESRAGLAHNALSRIETGQVSPRVGTLERIAQALELSIEELQFRAPPEASSVNESVAVYQLTERIQKLGEGKRQVVLEAFNRLLDQMDVD